MKKMLTVMLILASVLFIFADLEEIYSQVMERYETVETYEAELQQQNYWQELDQAKASRGKIYFNRDSLYINYLDPDLQRLFVLDDTVIMYDQKSNQAIYMDKGDFAIKPIEVIDSYWQKSEKEIISQTEEGSEIKLTNLAEVLIIRIVNGLIKGIMIKDESGNTVDYQFAREKLNQALPAGIFAVEFPENTNLIDNRAKGEK